MGKLETLCNAYSASFAYNAERGNWRLYRPNDKCDIEFGSAKTLEAARRAATRFLSKPPRVRWLTSRSDTEAAESLYDALACVFVIPQLALLRQGQSAIAEWQGRNRDQFGSVAEVLFDGRGAPVFIETVTSSRQIRLAWANWESIPQLVEVSADFGLDGSLCAAGETIARLDRNYGATLTVVTVDGSIFHGANGFWGLVDADLGRIHYDLEYQAKHKDWLALVFGTAEARRKAR